MLALLIGIFSSLFATAIFVSMSELVRRVVIPWYADKIYRGARIDGRWEAEQVKEYTSKDKPLEMYMDLVQRGDTIHGTYSHKVANGEIDIYNLSGLIRDRYFLATAVPSSNRQLDGIAMILYMDNKQNKLLLSGQMIYCDDNAQVGPSVKVIFSWRKP
jgi:hypothetical protein